MYNDILKGLTTIEGNANAFDLVKLGKNEITEEIINFIQENSIINSIRMYQQYINSSKAGALKFSLPLFLNLKNNLKNCPPAQTTKYI